MSALQDLELKGHKSFASLLDDRGKKKLHLDRLRSLTISGRIEIVEIMTRLVVPLSGISISLELIVTSLALERERIITILDTASTLSRCGMESPQRPRRIVRSAYIQPLFERAQFFQPPWSPVS